jgi:hypothetical protein
MQETSGRPRWRAWLPRIFAVVVLVAAGVVVLVRTEVIGGPTPAERTATITAELDRRMTTTLEQLPATGHAGHGAQAGAGGRTLCGTRVYGYEPEDARTADAVVTVYGFHLCAVAEPRGTWDFATKYVSPLVMRADTDPPTFQMVESTVDVSYRDRIKQLIPEHYQRLANEGALEPGDMADLRRRFDAAVTG